MKKTIRNYYLTRQVLPIWTVLFIDLLFTVVSILLAYALRYNFEGLISNIGIVSKTIITAVILNIP